MWRGLAFLQWNVGFNSRGCINRACQCPLCFCSHGREQTGEAVDLYRLTFKQMARTLRPSKKHCHCNMGLWPAPYRTRTRLSWKPKVKHVRFSSLLLTDGFHQSEQIAPLFHCVSIFYALCRCTLCPVQITGLHLMLQCREIKSQPVNDCLSFHMNAVAL